MECLLLVWMTKVGPGILCELSWAQTGGILAQLVLLTAWRMNLQCFVTIKSNKRLSWCWRKEGWRYFAATVLVDAWRRYFQTVGKVWCVLGWGTLGCSQEEAAAGFFFPCVCLWNVAVVLSCDKWITNPFCGLVSFSETGNKRGFS